ncbi:hypothetical protein FTO60_11115 [Octadecabacter sp. SW4]|uniref:hypothetical protein n=1 Tax=Octadecabacter sp. SW4 TaxID=2602067 RepID=UPI0011C20491|nr:hypothetical protein [Octadecabacter sp. SW4]QEE36208.1 hypothetical protein FTO60_11115 [Octadecabacter sp. SW4]
MMVRFLPFLVLATPAVAECLPQGETFVSCTIAESGKQLEVCINGGDALYTYGAAGQAPELALREPIRDLDYRPWPGIGRTIWEEIAFARGGYAYLVFGGINREASDIDDEIQVTAFGGVEVYQGETLLTRLSCVPETVDFTWTNALSDGKRAAGLEWDLRARRWVPIGQN